jgi:hypothetical protein
MLDTRRNSDVKRITALLAATLLAASVTSAAAATEVKAIKVKPLLVEILTDTAGCHSALPYAYRAGYAYVADQEVGSSAIYFCASHELVSADDWQALEKQTSLKRGHMVIMGINRMPAEDSAKHD